MTRKQESQAENRPVNPQRLANLGSSLIAVSSAGLAVASFAILGGNPSLASSSGRHLLAGALANIALSIVLLVISVFPLRRGERWAFWVITVVWLVYGVPILVVDAIYVPSENLTLTLAPQAIGNIILLAGLVLVRLGSRQNRTKAPS